MTLQRLLAVLAASLWLGASSSMAQENAVSGTGAVIRALDKVSGQTTDAEINSGSSGTLFGLEVELADCRYPPENPTGDAWAFLIVRDAEGPVVFSGWMVASSPALNAADHARYDVWVLRCITS